MDEAEHPLLAVAQVFLDIHRRRLAGLASSHEGCDRPQDDLGGLSTPLCAPYAVPLGLDGFLHRLGRLALLLGHAIASLGLGEWDGADALVAPLDGAGGTDGEVAHVAGGVKLALDAVLQVLGLTH